MTLNQRQPALENCEELHRFEKYPKSRMVVNDGGCLILIDTTSGKMGEGPLRASDRNALVTRRVIVAVTFQSIQQN